MDRDYMQRIHILIPASYMVTSQEYLQRVIDKLDKMDCGYTIVTQFLDEEKQARLSRAVDIFVNSQTTDMFSASMQEYLYAGALMLKASWLSYPVLDEIGCSYIEFDEWVELVNVVPFAISALESGTFQSEANKRIGSLTRWSSVSDEWYSVYL